MIKEFKTKKSKHRLRRMPFRTEKRGGITNNKRTNNSDHINNYSNLLKKGKDLKMKTKQKIKGLESLLQETVENHNSSRSNRAHITKTKEKNVGLTDLTIKKANSKVGVKEEGVKDK